MLDKIGTKLYNMLDMAVCKIMELFDAGLNWCMSYDNVFVSWFLTMTYIGMILGLAFAIVTSIWDKGKILFEDVHLKVLRFLRGDKYDDYY